MLVRERAVYVFLKVVGRSCGAEADARHILLGAVLELLGTLAGVADAHQKDTGGQGVQRTGVTHLEILLAEVLYSRELEFADNIGRRPAERLVHGKDDAAGIIGNVAGEGRHLQGILSMRFW